MANRRDDVTGMGSTALLFDLDGTLVDTDHEHLKAFQRVLAPHGIELDRALYTAHIMGSSNALVVEKFLPHLPQEERAELFDAKEASYRESLGELTAIAGLREFLDWADAQGLAKAVVTNAPRANAELVLDVLGLTDRLPHLVIGPELERPKPDPMPYAQGLALTGAQASHSVAFEDSISGLSAAVAAGLPVIGLTTTLSEARLVEAGAVFGVADYSDARIFAFIEARRTRA